ncbi:MAG: hypothetical protein IPK50_13475 [Fibrobacterota bacterium]|nr:hypothetical protein [Fibrobacterota bacterium]QQS03317.1 MAG: hypothetical protein IPK50_13475 [Fibrobacterota bacterium]
MGETRRKRTAFLIGFGTIFGSLVAAIALASSDSARDSNSSTAVFAMFFLGMTLVAAVASAYEKGRNPLIWGVVAILLLLTFKILLLGIPFLSYTEKRREELRFDSIDDDLDGMA